MKSGDSLLVLTYDLLGKAYEAVNALPEDVSLAELLPTAGGSILLLSGPSAVLVLLAEKLPRPRSEKFINQIPTEVMDAWLGISNPPLESHFAVFETDSVGDAFEAAVRLSKNGMVPFDLRILRGAQVKCYVLATGRTETLALQDLDGVLTLIEEPARSLKDFFEIAPR